ncbi:M48 family metalloprotease [Streptomyces sp. MBT62]|uniref:M48 family metalloprotease n=1 Tax=Streptomyces sp. MBT62 TaxID=2800410 RepID=UPI00190CF9A3|nr:M48 family metalloprotease [Streptomyces sp. MBT62]MBK3570994.1 M48 family metalloprotease [Streptomyces sp. MBT62]
MTEHAGVFEGMAPRAVPTRPATVPERLLRARTDLRFAVLVGAVLASSVVAFSVVCAALPSSERLSRDRVGPCLARIDPATAWIAEQSDRLNAHITMANACERPYFLHEAGYIAIGLMVEAAFAVLLYALHPWWPRLEGRPTGSVRLPRWSRKVRLTGDENADVLEELNSLARTSGLSRPPLWLVDPYATTTGGRAYGLPGRPRICLDVGLLVRYDLDRDGFLAVVGHELAHHRHRDVGRTYLTVALWWSFVATALIPCVLLSVHPRALLEAGGSGGGEKLTYRLVALAALTVTAYLARNMILRARELHADAVAHSWDFTRGSLPRMVTGLPWPPCSRAVWRWVPTGWSRWAARAGTHPSPGQRVAAMLDPVRLLRTGAWEMAGIGLLAGLALHNLALLTGNVTGRFVTVGLTLLALPAGVVVTSTLASALVATAGRRTPVDAEEVRSRWDVVVLPAALTGGMVCSGKISLGTADLTAVEPTLGQYALLGLVQLAILLPLALWTRSVHRCVSPEESGVARGPRPRAIVATAGAVWGPLLALWDSRRLSPADLTGTPLHAVPAVGRTIGWYTALTGDLADAYFYVPLVFIRATPFLPVGLVLVWAVPLLLARRRRGSLAAAEDIGRALTVGAVAGLGAVAAGIALPFAARGALPPEVRRAADPSAVLGTTLPFSVVHASTYLAMAALLQAAAAAGTALICRGPRPVLVPLAVTVTAVLSTLGFYVSRGTSLCVAVTGVPPDDCGARAFLPDADVAFHLHEVVAWGVVAAVPAGVLGAAVAALSGHGRRPSDGGTDTARGNARRATLILPMLGLLAALPLAGAAAGIPQDYLIWRPAAPAVVAQPPTDRQDTSSSSVRNDPCLLGSWRAFPARQRLRIDGSDVWLTGEGGTWTFRPDGTLIVDHGEGVSETSTLHGRPVVLRTSGSVTTRYRTANGRIGYYGSAVRHPGELSLRVGETYLVHEKRTASFSPDRYRCAGKAVHLTPASRTTDFPYEVTLTRLPSKTPPPPTAPRPSPTDSS